MSSPGKAAAADHNLHGLSRLIFYDAAGTQGNIATKAFDHGKYDLD